MVVSPSPKGAGQEKPHWLGYDNRVCCECHTGDGVLELVQMPGWANTDRIHPVCRMKAQEEMDERIVDACYDCHGTGRYDDVMPCDTCDGEGTLDF